jgi:hypothetical protein
LAVARAELLGADADPVRVAKRAWPGDQVTPLLVERATSNVADTTTSGWAAELRRWGRGRPRR